MSDDIRARIDTFMAGYQDSVILLTASRLGLFAALGDNEHPEQPGPARSAAELAADCSLDARGVETVLLALVGAGVLERHADGRFALREEVAPLLLPAGAESLASIIDHHFHLLKRWVHLDEVLRSGKPVARERERGPDELRAFICGMRDISRRSSREVADRIDLSGGLRLLDLGGGPGTSSITFARRHPDLTCVVFDLPEVVPLAAEEIAAAGLTDRITTRPGDFLVDELGDGFDVAYVSNIIHSLAPDELQRLCARCAAALVPGGRIVLKDFFLDDSRTEPPYGARFAVNMLVNTVGGRSYTWRETETALARAGFGGCERLPVARASGLIVARRSR
jgi:SAM-dependent methyltransferase